MNATSLRRQMKNGAYNFFWIAGLSLANSIYFVLTANYGFVVGLGVTQFLDIIFHNIAQSFPNSVLMIQSSGLLLDVFICGVFILCGVLAVKGYRLAFIAGMILYGLDAILTLVSPDFIGFGFHLFFLWFLFSGLKALDAYKIVLSETNSNSVLPKNFSS